MKAIRKVIGMALAVCIAVTALSGCKTTDQRYYYCTRSGHTTSYIRLNKDSSSSGSGSGYAYKVMWTDGWWDMTGSFTYTTGDSVKITTGIYRNQVVDWGVSINVTSTTIKFAGVEYKH